MSKNWIVVSGAREHNLKNVEVRIPRDKLTVITGLSGSGKSSLAFDTIYAEGQRKYVESLSAYARQFLEQMQKAGRRFHRGSVPGHLHRAAHRRQQPALHRGHHHRDPRLPAAALRQHRPAALPQLRKPGGAPARPQQIVEQLAALPEGRRVMLLAPLVAGKKGEHLELIDGARKAGFRAAAGRWRECCDIDAVPKLDKKRKHRSIDRGGRSARDQGRSRPGASPTRWNSRCAPVKAF